ncbi:hypothetical protein DERP_005357 [Dermatophagoides pteronyssinus]|uniref:Uncharacterized protein n=1 Tax=Dermatophagoides pteronyssinus TaxID=6956 RepID=A0ABQ8JNA4_DERPT|nr:hypothetical protein DERP_005357 [Dermatophagoides pteronyssinus]
MTVYAYNNLFLKSTLLFVNNADRLGCCLIFEPAKMLTEPISKLWKRDPKDIGRKDRNQPEKTSRH